MKIVSAFISFQIREDLVKNPNLLSFNTIEVLV